MTPADRLRITLAAAYPGTPIAFLCSELPVGPPLNSDLRPQRQPQGAPMTRPELLRKINLACDLDSSALAALSAAVSPVLARNGLSGESASVAALAAKIESDIVLDAFERDTCRERGIDPALALRAKKLSLANKYCR